MKCTVYVLRLKGKRRLYIGVTSDFNKRVKEHKLGLVKSTRNQFDTVLYTEEFVDKKKAWSKEKWMKSGIGREWIHGNIVN